MTIPEYLTNKQMRSEFTFCIDNGRCFYRKNGVEFSVDEIHKAYPLPDTLLTRVNPDKKYVP